MASVQIKRGTRAQIEAAKTANGLLNGEPYLITDESRLAVGTATNAYSDCAKKSEVDGKEPALGNPASDGQVLASTAAGVRSWVDGASNSTTPNLITTTYSVPADTSIMVIGTLEITATGALDNSGNVGVW